MAGVAVDLDNTLTERPPVFEAWLSDFLHEHAIEDPAASAEIRGLDADGFGDKQHMFEVIRRRWQLAPSVGELIESFYGGTVERTELSDAARQGLSRLVDAGYDVLVVTNGSPRQQDKVDRLRLRDLVTALPSLASWGYASRGPASSRQQPAMPVLPSATSTG